MAYLSPASHYSSTFQIYSENGFVGIKETDTIPMKFQEKTVSVIKYVSVYIVLISL
jgi:hypothetical protein